MLYHFTLADAFAVLGREVSSVHLVSLRFCHFWPECAFKMNFIELPPRTLSWTKGASKFFSSKNKETNLRFLFLSPPFPLLMSTAVA